MDFATLDTGNIDGAPLEVLHPGDDTVLRDSNGDPVKIWLIGADSEKVHRRQQREINKRIKRGNRVKLTAEEIEEHAISLLAFCTVSWSGVVVDGESLPCTEENARRLYSRFIWLREQVDAFIGDRSNFLKASLTM